MKLSSSLFLEILAVGAILPRASSDAQNEASGPTGSCATIPPIAPRSIDGSDRDDDLGAAETPLLRLASTLSYPDGDGEELRAGPNARNISNAVSAQQSLSGNSKGLSDIFWQFGQFLDHDLDLTAEGSSFGTAPIPVLDPSDPFAANGCSEIRFDRSEHTGSVPRQHKNEITHFIDASNVYGSDASTAASLRTFVDGLLKTSQDGQMLPKVDGFYEAGDLRANEQAGLTVMHALFVREHNRLAVEIKNKFCDATDEEIYQLARKLVGATMQIITYKEFLPALLGSAAPGVESVFSTDVDPSISSEFSTVAYRVGHTMVSPVFRFLNEQNIDMRDPMPLREMFFEPDLFQGAAINVDYILGGQMRQQCQEIDHQVIDELRVFLFPDLGGCLDLASLNIQRGRDHGILAYNGLRQVMGLAPAATFADITPDASLQAKLASVYSSVDDVDAWVGGLSEERANGVVGELFESIIVDQFVRLRDGDPFWYANDPEVNNDELLGFWDVSEVSMDKVIRDNTIHQNCVDVFFATQTSGAMGDPHFKTTSGHGYDFHGSCDLVLVHAPKFSNGMGLDIHIRTQARYQYSYIESVALRIGNDVLEVGSWGENFFNGVENTDDSFPKTMGGIATVTYERENKKRQRFEIILDHHSKIVVSTFKDLVSVTVDNSARTLIGESTGMLGGANGQMLARDGVTVLESDPNAFGMEWQVRDTEAKLFQNMDRYPQYPQKCAMPKVSMESRRLGEASGIGEEEAVEACKKQGRINDLDGCVYDILATGDLELAQAGGF